MFSTYGGNLDRPLLVIYTEFSDAPYPAGRDAVWARQFFFGPGFPNVTGWYADNSFGHLTLSPASETQGVSDDGVVSLNAGLIASYNAIYPDEGMMNRVLMSLADPFVDFSVFDSDGNGTLTSEELVVANIRVHYDIDSPGPDDDQQSGGNRTLCDGTPAPCPGLTLDGVSFDLSFQFAMGLHAECLATWDHEIGHTVLDMNDLYAFPVGFLELGGPTLANPLNFTYDAGAWSRVHFGWISPTVVTRDGFYDVPAAHQSPTAFILYDPARGTNDYFIVENRRPIAGTYDQNAHDDGLIVWRIDETKYNPPSDASGAEGGPITTRQPNQVQVAWDPSDPQSPERTMTSPWRDGTPNEIAVRAIGPRGDVVRAYFDVCGPGILVDTYSLQDPIPTVVAGALESVTVPVMNTGGASDDFEFSVTGLPSGWTAFPRAASLAPGGEMILALGFIPAHDAPSGIVTAAVTGTSLTDPTVTSSAPLSLNVIHESDLEVRSVALEGLPPEILAGDTHVATLRVQVRNRGPSWPTDGIVSGAVLASSGNPVTPTSWSQPAPALELDTIREITQAFTIGCDAPGIHDLTFTVTIQPALPGDTDPVHANDSAQVAVSIDCVVPIVINIRPGGELNQLNPKAHGVLPVAALTTAPGEYGLPFAFDATTIDPLSVRFGSPATLKGGGGAGETHGVGHPGDSFELDDMTMDGDLDMLLHFRIDDLDAMVDDREGCLTGEYVAADGTRFRFFGCDSMNVQVKPTAQQVVQEAASGQAFALSAALPNPLRDKAVIEYVVPAGASWATLSIFDAQGRRVRLLVGGPTTEGPHQAEWNARDDSGNRLEAGVYFVRLEIDGRRAVRKVVVSN